MKQKTEYSTRLELPKRDRPTGLYLYCNKCKKKYSDDSSFTNNGICKGKCNFNNTLVYKAIIHVKGTDHAVKSKVLSAKNFRSAVVEFMEYKDELLRNNYKAAPKINPTYSGELVKCMALYIDYLSNVNVPYHRRKIRTKAHIQEVERYFAYSLEALVNKKIDVKHLHIKDLSDYHVGIISEYLIKKKKLGARSYNRFMSLMRSFINHNVVSSGTIMSNPFYKVYKPVGKTEIVTISKEEFIQLKEVITPENGIRGYNNRKDGAEFYKSLYKPWLYDAFRLALYTGRRREELVNFKFKDIICNEKGEMLYLKSNHLKINRSKGLKDVDLIMEKIFISGQLRALLNELGYDHYKGKDIYILAPNETMSRISMMNLMSKAFPHYYAQLNTGKKVQFKDLRKTFITSVYNFLGNKARLVTKHASVEVMLQHYIDDNIITEKMRGFEVF